MDVPHWGGGGVHSNVRRDTVLSHGAADVAFLRLHARTSYVFARLLPPRVRCAVGARVGGWDLGLGEGSRRIHGRFGVALAAALPPRRPLLLLVSYPTLTPELEPRTLRTLKYDWAVCRFSDLI